MTVLAKRLRKQGGVPAYKSWSYLMHNEQANETGGRVFYTDATGAVLAAVHTLLAVCMPPNKLLTIHTRVSFIAGSLLVE